MWLLRVDIDIHTPLPPPDMCSPHTCRSCWGTLLTTLPLHGDERDFPSSWSPETPHSHNCQVIICLVEGDPSAPLVDIIQEEGGDWYMRGVVHFVEFHSFQLSTLPSPDQPDLNHLFKSISFKFTIKLIPDDISWWSFLLLFCSWIPSEIFNSQSCYNALRVNLSSHINFFNIPPGCCCCKMVLWKCPCQCYSS